VELNEAIRRILVRHWVVVMVGLMLGLGASLGTSLKETRTFTATSRITLDTTAPKSSAEATANSDTARAIVTSPNQVSTALNAAGARRNVQKFAKSNIDVRALGSSAVVEIGVTDRDREVAAKVANALATNVVKLRLDASRGDANRLARELDASIAEINKKLVQIDQKFAQASTQAAGALLAQRDDLSRQLDTIELQRLDLSRELTVTPKPTVVQTADVPDRMDPSRIPLNVALGGILGLVLGVGIATVLETLRPTLVTPRGLARAAGAPVLGVLKHSPDSPEPQEIAVAATRLQLAAATAEVDTVALIASGPPLDLQGLVDAIHKALAEAFLMGARQPRRLWVQKFALAVPESDYRTGLVLVAPTALPKTELDVVSDVLSITGWPLLGVVAYRATPPRRPKQARGAEPDSGDVRDLGFASSRKQVAEVTQAARRDGEPAGERGEQAQMIVAAERPLGQVPDGRVVFVGAVHEAEPALRALLSTGVEVAGVFTLGPRLAARTWGFVDLEPLAAAHGVPVLRTENLNHPDEVERVRALAPDLIVEVGWTRLLGDELLAIPPRGCVGFHASMLPRDRGRAPVNWAIIRGDTETGNTMMFLAPGADTGDIIDQRPVSIEPDDTCGTVYAKVGAAGAEMLRAHLPALLAGTAPRRPQEESPTPNLSKRTPDMGITDWSRPPRAVHDWIRALSHPYPGAFTFLAGRKLLLWRSESPGHEPAGEPGRLLGCEGEALRVGSGGGSLRLLRVQVEGGSEESAASWYRRQRLSPGTRFDPVDAATAEWALGLRPAGVAANQEATP
jgi:methionyl-tRNA formyltransferase